MRALYRGPADPPPSVPGLPRQTERCILVPGKARAPANAGPDNQLSLRPSAVSKGGFMKTRKTLYLGVVASALAALLSACLSTQGTGSTGANDIGGVVTGPNGPEAGVWVIAET